MFGFSFRKNKGSDTLSQRRGRGTWWGPPTTDPPEPPAAAPEPPAKPVPPDIVVFQEGTEPPKRPPDVEDIPPEDLPAPPSGIPRSVLSQWMLTDDPSAPSAESCLADDTPPPKTHKAATCYINLDTIARLLRLPGDVRVTGVLETIYGGPSHRRFNQCMMRLEGDGLPDNCRVDTGDPIRAVNPQLKVDREGNVEFAGWE